MSSDRKPPLEDDIPELGLALGDLEEEFEGVTDADYRADDLDLLL